LRYQTTSGFLKIVLKTMEWISCHCATQVIGVSQGIVEKLVSDRLCNHNKIMLVGYGSAGGVDINKFSRDAIIGSKQHIRKDLGLSEEDFVFCFVGRIVKDKGINELVEAFDKLSKEYDKLHLMLIGPEEESDPISAATKELIKSHGRIFFLGRQNDVRSYIAACNALVLPSYREGFGQVILEANALEIPCICTDIVGPRDVIDIFVNGELVKARDIYSLYQKMKEWVDNPSFVKEMGKTSRTYVESRFAQDIVRNNYYQEYCRLAKLQNKCD
jgi:glycosyltransferase involved in cell wall biosynthesis